MNVREKFFLQLQAVYKAAGNKTKKRHGMFPMSQFPKKNLRRRRRVKSLIRIDFNLLRGKLLIVIILDPSPS